MERKKDQNDYGTTDFTRTIPSQKEPCSPIAPDFCLRNYAIPGVAGHSCSGAPCEENTVAEQRGICYGCALLLAQNSKKLKNFLVKLDL